MKDSDSAIQFYGTPIRENDRSRTIFDVWERGQSLGDCTTPAVSSPEYRAAMTALLASLSKGRGPVLAIGCGNGFVEAELMKLGVCVAGIDLMQEAVDLAAQKGIPARRASFFELSHADVQPYGVLYADGVLGHFFDTETLLGHFFEKLCDLALDHIITLVCSFDEPSAGVQFERHPSVPRFYFLSVEFVSAQFHRHGFSVVDTLRITYGRPISGPRTRGICICESR